MVEVPVLQEQQTGRPPWMAQVPVLQEQQTGRFLFSAAFCYNLDLMVSIIQQAEVLQPLSLWL